MLSPTIETDWDVDHKHTKLQLMTVSLPYFSTDNLDIFVISLCESQFLYLLQSAQLSLILWLLHLYGLIDWARFYVPLDTFLGHFGDGAVNTASARIIATASPTVCAVLSSECATTVDNSGVYVYYLKGIVSVCF